MEEGRVICGRLTWRAIGVVLVVLLAFACGTPIATPSTSTVSPSLSTAVGWIDTHTHLTGNVVESGVKGQAVCSSEECLDRIIAAMDEHGAQTVLLMHPPAPAGVKNLEGEVQIVQAVQSRTDRLAYVGGGAILNPLIQQAARDGGVSPVLRQEFEDAARQLVDMGAVGFGEIAGLHLSGGEAHAFEEAAPDGPLFLLLADLAAQYDVPIDIHLEAVVSDMSIPTEFQRRSSRNPEMLHANIEAFERLLDHNRDARIVWAHVGWDHLGDLTPDLVGRLIKEHSNLYIQLRIAKGLVAEHSVMDSGGNIRASWLDLIEAYPDRFLLGSDTFFGDQDIDERNVMSHEAFLGQLSPDLARKVGCENVVTIYRLSVTCAR